MNEDIYLLFFQLDLALKDKNGGDISSFIMNGEWDLIGKILVCSSPISIISYSGYW